MAREEIVEKLNEFVTDHDPVTEECHVVYFMVQARKILEHEQDHRNTGNFTYLRFFCDWIAHTKKDAITDSMKKVMETIFIDVKAQIENKVSVKGQNDGQEVVRFVYMEKLHDEMEHFLKDHGINLKIVEGDWLAFVRNLVKVLENQPIIKPTDDITSFIFLPAAEGCVRVRVSFKDKVDGYDYLDFSNAY